jgi:hypothetical protein
MFDLAEAAESDEQLKMVRQILSGDQTGADRAELDSQFMQAWNTEDMFLGAERQRTGESMTGTTWLNSQPPLILRIPGGTSRKATVP